LSVGLEGRIHHPRAVVTRDKIVGAAITCLSELGYAGASTTAIARCAGVSQGALFKHFPAKHLLLGVATERVFEAVRGRFVEEALERTEPGREMIAGLEVLWEIYLDERLQAVFELYVATRTDEALRGVLEPVVAAHFVGIMEIAGVLFPAAAGTPRFTEAVTSLMLTLQGAALMIGMAPSGHDTRLSLEFLAQFAVAVLGVPDVAALAALRTGE
jgi:AcrR family transcriptional regulator